MIRLESDCMQENVNSEPAHLGRKLSIAPGSMLRGEPAIPASKYYTLRYMLAATLAKVESTGAFPALSDDSEAVFGGCRVPGAQVNWRDTQQQMLQVTGVGRRHGKEPFTINVGNRGAVLRLLLG